MVLTLITLLLNMIQIYIILYNLHVMNLCNVICLINLLHQLLFHTLVIQVVGPNCDRVQYSHITQVEEKEGKYYFNLSSLFQNPLCEYGVSSFFTDIESINLSNESNEFSFFRSVVLGNNNFDDDNYIDVSDDEFPSAQVDISVSHENFNLKYLDLEFFSVKENALIKASSLSHYPFFSPICDARTCDEDTPCSSSSSAHELTSQFTQGSEVFYDERENNHIIEYTFDPISSLVLYEDNSSNHITHEIPPSLDLQSEESFNLINLIIEVVKSDQISDKHG